MEYPKVYIVILNWNGWKDTIECLESVFKTDYPNYQVIVVDNGSTDDSIERINYWAKGKPKLEIIETKKNLGFAAGNNVALRYVLERNDFEYVWLINNDIVAHPDALKNMVGRMQEDKKIGICGCVILDYYEPSKISALGGFYDKWLGQAYCKKIESKMDYVPGASMLVSKEFLNDIGLMCEDYFLFFEEIDWAVRARNRYSLAIALNAIVYHKGSASVKRKESETNKKQKRYSLLYDHYTTRNRLLFTGKFHPYLLPFVYLSILGYLLDRIAYREWDNVRTMVKAVFNRKRGE